MSNLDELHDKVEAFDSLTRHPGWLLLVDHLQKRASASMSEMRNAKTSDELLRHTYTYMALADLPKAPEMLRDVMAQNLQRALERK
jgi:hypothetical protein